MFAPVSAGAGEQVPKAPLNALSIADITGIPRETVRRKPDRLTGKGWVERDQNRHWRVSRQGADALRGCTDPTLADLGELRRVLIKA